MSELSEIYQEIILDHNKRPRNFGELPESTCSADGHNPLCGDELTIYVIVDGDTVCDIRFEGQGCAISKASASLMTLKVKGKPLAEVKEAILEVCDMLTAQEEPADLDALGDLAALSGVRQFPMRIKCATLAWHTLKAALEGNTKTTTE
tara:strand:+ start:84343 stop:84789 length:447 start_codon:yes stop_codon:yes gene_type:complete